MYPNLQRNRTVANVCFNSLYIPSHTNVLVLVIAGTGIVGFDGIIL